MKLRSTLLSLGLLLILFTASACGAGSATPGTPEAGTTAAGMAAGGPAADVPAADVPAADDPASAEIYLSLGTSQGQFGSSFSSLAAKLQQESGGRIFLNVYAGGQMGGDDVLLDAVNHRTLSMVQSSTIVQISQVPELALLDIPYVFDSLSQCTELLNGPLKDFFQHCYNAGGLQLLSWYSDDYRVITTDRPVRSPGSLKELRIRTVGNPYHAVYWKALGAEPVSVRFSDTIYAAETRQINAQENSSKASISLGIHRLQPWLLRTRHLPFINTVVMNLEEYESLSKEDQEFLSDFFSRSTTLLGSAGYDSDPSGYFHVLDPKEDTMTALKDAADAVEAAVRSDLGDEITDRYLEIVRQ